MLAATAAIATAVMGWVGLGVAETSLALAPRSDEAVEFLDAADAAIEQGRDVLGVVAEASRSVAASTEQAISSLEAIADMTENQIPSALTAVEATMPALIDTAAIIDDTMRTLAALGIPYAPEVPIDETLRLLRDEIAGLPATISEQGTALREMLPEVREAARQVDLVPDHLEEMDASLGNAQAVLADYREALESDGVGLEPATAIRAGRAAALILGLAGVGLGAAGWRLADRVSSVRATPTPMFGADPDQVLPGATPREEPEMNCPHGPCRCQTDDGGYCSQHCEDMATTGVVMEQCQCGHPQCTEET